jgi:hypothetical protein
MGSVEALRAGPRPARTRRLIEGRRAAAGLRALRRRIRRRSKVGLSNREVRSAIAAGRA